MKGLCSRREAAKYLSCGLVLLGDKLLQPFEVYVHPNAPVKLAPRAQRLAKQKLTIILNKPLHFLASYKEGRVRPDAAAAAGTSAAAAAAIAAAASASAGAAAGTSAAGAVAAAAAASFVLSWFA